VPAAWQLDLTIFGTSRFSIHLKTSGLQPQYIINNAKVTARRLLAAFDQNQTLRKRCYVNFFLEQTALGSHDSPGQPWEAYKNIII
jgi:hypothetical protein